MFVEAAVQNAICHKCDTFVRVEFMPLLEQRILMVDESLGDGAKAREVLECDQT
jgi:hypothetical protein